MSVRSNIIQLIQQIASDNKIDLPPLTDELLLAESGLDSLAIAILVARLEEGLGLDPFNEAEEFPDVVTLGGFIKFYENTAKLHDLDSRQAG